jgi:hypothetical protein
MVTFVHQAALAALSEFLVKRLLRRTEKGRTIDLRHCSVLIEGEVSSNRILEIIIETELGLPL